MARLVKQITQGQSQDIDEMYLTLLKKMKGFYQSDYS